jgi:hypothetical protein
MYAGRCKHKTGKLSRTEYIIILFVNLLFIGCTPMAEISIQVLEPATITFPQHINQVGFINHSYIPLENPIDTSALSRNEVYILDTIVNNQIFTGLKDGMNDSPLFDLDSIHVIQSRRSDIVNFLAPFTADQLAALSQSEQADALISLEYYRMSDTTSVDRLDLNLLAVRRMVSNTVWRIYDQVLDTLIDEYMQKDTTEWYVIGEDPYLMVESLPEFINSLRKASYNAGYKYAQRISPSWFEVPRFYHTSGGKAMREAKRKAAALDWAGASAIWKRLAYQAQKKTAAKACFNMALVCEMEDLLIPSLDWAIKAYFIRQDRVTKDYIDLLKVRYLQQRLIKDQLPVDD